MFFRSRWIQCTLESDFFPCRQEKLTAVRLGKMKGVSGGKCLGPGGVRGQVKSVPLPVFIAHKLRIGFAFANS